MAVNIEELLEEEKNEINLSNISSNKKRVKRRDHNEFSIVTNIIKNYKKTNDDKYLLEAIKALEGIINTFTIIISPGDHNQQIYLNPYMKKFIGLFLSKEEQIKTTYQGYMQAVYRVRWIMRYWTYEDIYSKIIEMLIDVIKKIQVIGTCDCIYYIQFVMKFKMHSLIVKTAKDVMVDIKDMPTNFNISDQNDGYEDTIERVSSGPENLRYEDKLISSLYNEVDISILIRNDDIFKCLGSYEKYIIYLFDYLGLTSKQISNILKYDTVEEIDERIEDIEYKLKLLAK